MTSNIKVLIASGASGGHIYPAIALAESLKKKASSIEIAFVSSKIGMGDYINPLREQSFSNEIKNKVFFISIIKFRFNFSSFLKAVYYLAKSFLESFFIFEKFRPDVVVGFGSYVSFPLLLEAALFKKPAIIHEQNVSLGTANKFLSFFVDKIAVSFRQTQSTRRNFIFTGNPLRSSLTPEEKDKARSFFNLEEKFTILVLGGSQGSHNINIAFKDAVCLLAKEEDFQFIHITGRFDYSGLQKEYEYIKIKHSIFDFLPVMHIAYSLADLVISRSGAGTISELAYFRKPAILIPYPYARSHQLENAAALKKEQAAIVIEEEELSGSALKEKILLLIRSASMRDEFKNNIQKFANPDAADRLAEVVLEMAR